MAKRRPPMKNPDDEPVNEDWLTTYADAITLLMAFFIMLVSFSKIEYPAYEKIQAGIAQEIGKRDVIQPSQVLEADLRDIIFNLGIDQDVSLGKDDKGLVLELGTSDLFDPGSAHLKNSAITFLRDIGDLLEQPRYLGFMVEVAGYTDDTPISTDRFPSNWDLAAARAISVVRFLTDLGIDPEKKRLRAVSYGETHPKLPNTDDFGKPIPENRDANRRIVVRIFPKYAHVF